MPIHPKIILTAALLVASVMTVGARTQADDNPFARWEKAKQSQPLPPPVTKTEIQKATAQDTRQRTPANVTFFSAEAAQQKSSPSRQQQIAPVVLKERLKRVAKPETGRPISRVTIPSTSAGVVKISSMPQAGSTQQGQSPVGSGVMQMGFQPEGKRTNVIQQTAATFVQDGNPFEDFLGPANPSADSPEVAEPAFPAMNTATQLPAPDETANPFGEPFQPAPAVSDTNNSTPAEFDFDPQPFDPADSRPSALSIPVREVSVTERSPTIRRPAVVASSIGPQSPRVSIRWEHDRDFNVGQQCACDLIIENTGVTVVQDVVAEASLATGLEVISAVPNPDNVGDRAEWKLGALAPGQSRKISLVVVPQQQGDLQMNAFVRLSSNSSSSISVKQPALQVEVQGPENLAIGELANFTVEVANPGSGEARNVVLQAVIPEGLQHRQGRRLTIDIGTLNPGESRRARLSLSGVEGGPQSIAVRVTGDGDLTDEGEAVVAVAEPKLNIGVRGPKESEAGKDARFEVVVVNEGKVDSSNVRARYRLPEGYEFRSSDRGGKYNPTDRTIDWFVGTLEPNQIKHFEVTLRASRPGEFHHQVGVISELGKMTMAEQTTQVAGSAKLGLKVTSNGRQVRSNGGQTMFEVRLTNSGTSAAEAVGLSFEVPPGLELAEISGPSKYISDSGVVMFRALPAIQPQETVTFRIATKCVKAGQHNARVRVASRSVPQPIIEEVNVTGIE